MPVDVPCLCQLSVNVVLAKKAIVKAVGASRSKLVNAGFIFILIYPSPCVPFFIIDIEQDGPIEQFFTFLVFNGLSKR